MVGRLYVLEDDPEYLLFGLPCASKNEMIRESVTCENISPLSKVKPTATYLTYVHRGSRDDRHTTPHNLKCARELPSADTILPTLSHAVWYSDLQPKRREPDLPRLSQ